MKHHMIVFFLVLGLLFPPLAQAQAQTQVEHVHVRLIPARTHVAGGEKVMIAIEQNIGAEWHTYWTNPGDSGATPRLSWDLPDNYAVGEIAWPVPHRIPYADLINLGYEGNITMLQALSLPPVLPPGAITLKAQMEILVCKDICIPEVKDLSLTLNDPAQESVDNAAVITSALATMPIPLEGFGTYGQEGNTLVMTITSNALPDNIRKDVGVLPLEWGILKYATPLKIESPDPQTLILRQQRDYRDLAEITSLPVLLSFSTDEGQYAALAITLTPDPSSTPPLQSSVMPVVDAPPVIMLGFMKAVLFAILGGLVLNLMPCVFPVLSIKAIKLAQLKDKGTAITALNGLAYTAGILVCFSLIGGALLVLKTAGSQIGWGFQLQDPLVILGLSYLLFIIGLNFSGFFDFSGMFENTGASLAEKHGLSGAFFTGALAALVATPCTAPFMAGALGYALIQPPLIAMTIFMALGFGLALPYLLLCLIPGAAKILPRPGIWMLRMKEFLAFPMYASAAWLVWVLSLQAGALGMLWALFGMVAIAFSIWLLTVLPTKKTARIALTLIALFMLFLASWPLMDRSLLHIPEHPALGAQGLENDERAFSEKILQKALSGDGGVFTYMTAAWCITCKMNERVALLHPDTQNTFKRNNIIVLRGDWTNQNPEITAYLRRYGRSGIPLYVYYPKRNPLSGQRPDPVVLPQVLTPGIIADAINK